MIEFREVLAADGKARICSDILRALPNWFGAESGIVDYVSRVQSLPFYGAFDKEEPVGFAAMKVHNAFTSEVCVMGILKDYHRQGIGKKLIELCESYCKANKLEFLTVKTLDASRESRSYEKTRQFYLSVGFRPLEVFLTYWDEDNPCLLMAKSIR